MRLPRTGPGIRTIRRNGARRGMTAPLRWRSQLCPCGYCPDGTRIEWRYSIDIRFRPRSARARNDDVKH